MYDFSLMATFREWKPHCIQSVGYQESRVTLVIFGANLIEIRQEIGKQRTLSCPGVCQTSNVS